MQGTMDIMAMIQKSNAVKQKPMAASIGNGVIKASFKSELAEARRSSDLRTSDKQPTEPVKQETATENKAEKLAKVMSNNKVAAEKVDKAPTEEVKEEQSLTENQIAPEAEGSESTKSVKETQETAQSETADSDTAMAELVASAQDLVQQVIQLINSTNTGEAEPESAKQLEASIQAVSQKLEQIASDAADKDPIEVKTALKDLKLELKELISQLKTQADPTTDTPAIDKPSLQQKVDIIKHLINKMNTLKPVLHEKLANPENLPELVKQSEELPVKENKDINKNNDVKSEFKQSEENVAVKAAEEPNPKEGKEKDSKESEKESTYSASTKEAPKHLASSDKHTALDLKIANALPNNQNEAQINLKELNLNQRKERLVTINKSDIVNQVVKKADIIVREGHSEMIMKLEPESLGKLNLKIVVEKGLITAKFVAESQQVKEVLESSFNQLKDALQEKGIAVQNFSVSVGQQAGDSSSNQSFNQWKQSLKIKSKASGDYIGIEEEAILNQNPYSYHDGKIDYRA